MSTPIREKERQLPVGFTMRPTQMDDAEAVCELENISVRAKGYPSNSTASDYRADWQSPKYDLSSSSIVVENVDGEIIAFANVWDNSDVPVRPWLSLMLHPEYQHQGIEDYLLDWLETTAERVIPRCPADAKISTFIGSVQGYEPRERYLKARGYQHVRTFHRMVVEHETAPPVANLADGFSFRTYQHPQQLADVVHAVRDSFRDHWGYVETSFDDDLEQWEHWLNTDEKFDPSLFFLVMDDATDRIAGVCLCRSEMWEDPTYAYVLELGVRPEYRRRGIALAMLHYSFGEFWKLGQPNVALHVDATSLTGANRVYGKAGMRADQQWANFEKVIRDGQNLATTNL